MKTINGALFVKAFLFLVMLIPIIGVSQSNKSRLYDLRFNYLRDKSSISFDDLLNRFPDSIANKTKFNENETRFVLDSVLSISYNSQPENTIYFNHYYKYDSKGNRIESKRLTNCVACSIGGNEKSIFTFDENGNTTSEIYFDLDLNSNERIPVYKTEMVYGINGIAEEHIFRKYATAADEWVQSSKTVHTYDGNGRLTKEIRYNWNDSNSSWQYSSKMEQEFDKKGIILIRENYTYNLVKSLWIGTVKEENVFKDGQILTGIRYEWNYELNQWRNQVKGEYTYDGNGIEKMEIGFKWNATDEIWENYYKYEFSINASGKVDKITTFKIDSSNQWIGAYREEYVYDENGNVILLVNSEWDTIISDWVSKYKIEREFNTNSQMTFELTYRWNKDQNDWGFNDKRTFDFDINGNIKTANYYSWKINNNNWYLHHNSESFYSALVTNNKYFTEFPDIQVYPNPAHEIFTIELQNNEFTSAQLFNSTGKLLKTLPLENGINTYNISELESGIYFIRIPQRDMVVVKKLVKN